MGAAVLAGLAVSGVLEGEPQYFAFLGATVLAGALFPDIDTDSRGQTLFYGLLLVGDTVLIVREQYLPAAWLGLAALLPVVVRHRGFIHSWWAMLLLPLPIILVPHVFFEVPLEVAVSYYGAFVLGYFSHLFLDRVF